MGEMNMLGVNNSGKRESVAPLYSREQLREKHEKAMNELNAAIKEANLKPEQIKKVTEYVNNLRDSQVIWS